MIRRELPDGTMLLIPQENHADVSAQFAAHWGNASFSRPTPYESVVFATIYHDSGHREVEAGLPVDVELGAPYGLRDMPAPFKREDANQANVGWVAGRNPYAGLLAAMHRTGLKKRRYDTVRSWQGDYAGAPTTDGASLGMDAAFEDLDDSLRQHLTELDAAARAGLWFNYRLLQVYDLLSLYVCCDGYQDGNLRSAGLARVPVAYESADEVEVRITPTGATAVRIEPYPFGEAPLTISTLAHRMAPVNAHAESDVREAYHRAPRELVSWEFQA
jgi:Protein of unknown function (DUF3891)